MKCDDAHVRNKPSDSSSVSGHCCRGKEVQTESFFPLARRQKAPPPAPRPQAYGLNVAFGSESSGERTEPHAEAVCASLLSLPWLPGNHTVVMPFTTHSRGQALQMDSAFPTRFSLAEVAEHLPGSTCESLSPHRLTAVMSLDPGMYPCQG